MRVTANEVHYRHLPSKCKGHLTEREQLAGPRLVDPNVLFNYEINRQ